MLVNAAPELAPYDPEFRQLVNEERMFIEAFFRRCATAGQQGGSIDRTRSPDDVGKLLLSVLLGVSLHGRARRARLLEGAANAVLALLGANK
jgi:TetR/AcrR family transcriptional repressor of nem operon